MLLFYRILYSKIVITTACEIFVTSLVGYRKPKNVVMNFPIVVSPNAQQGMGSKVAIGPIVIYSWVWKRSRCKFRSIPSRLKPGQSRKIACLSDLAGADYSARWLVHTTTSYLCILVQSSAKCCLIGSYFHCILVQHCSRFGKIKPSLLDLLLGF